MIGILVIKVNLQHKSNTLSTGITYLSMTYTMNHLIHQLRKNIHPQLRVPQYRIRYEDSENNLKGKWFVCMVLTYALYKATGATDGFYIANCKERTIRANENDF